MIGEALEQSWIPGRFAVELIFSARDTPRLVYNISEGRRKKPQGTTGVLERGWESNDVLLLRNPGLGLDGKGLTSPLGSSGPQRGGLPGRAR